MTGPEFFEKNRYIHVKGMIPKDICNIATQYSLYDHLQDFAPEGDNAQIPGTHSKYGDPLMETLLKFSKPHMEKHTGLKLIPTYAYYRVYKPGDILKRHKDRPSCEISTTITLGWKYKGVSPDYRWSMFVGDSDGSIGTKGNMLVCEPGDCIIYRGCEIEHWREPFQVGEGSWHTQVFLHYINADGPYAGICDFDGRPDIGYPNGSGTPEKKEAMKRADELLSKEKALHYDNQHIKEE